MTVGLSPLPDLSSVRAMAHKAVGLRDALDQQITETAQRIKAAETEEQLLELVSNLIRRLIDAEVTDGVRAVERLQTEGLREIFHDQELSVRAEVEESRGNISVSLLTQRVLKDGKMVEGSAHQSFGGSLLTMQSILMRITVIYRRNMRPILLLDETLAAVANRYVDRASRFLSSLCRRLGLDVLLITHDEAVVGTADRAYHVSYARDQAHVREMSGEAQKRST